MNEPNMEYQEGRNIWNDYNVRQEFEHELLDRKTQWMLTTEGILFAAYGLGRGAGTLPEVVAAAGLSIAAITFIGVLALINSKRRSWKQYETFYAKPEGTKPPRPLDDLPLQWGVMTWNTWLTLIPDMLFPIVFVIGWSFLLLE